MIIDFKDVQNCQVEFVKHLENKPGRINEKNKFGVTKGQVICLISELMEVCNADNLHKWWDKSEIDKDHVVEELSDLLAHICNVANYLDFKLVHDIEEMQIEDIEGSVISLISDMVQLVNTKNKTFVKHKLFVILTKYIQLVYALGFNIDELKESYHKKLKINYTRF